MVAIELDKISCSHLIIFSLAYPGYNLAGLSYDSVSLDESFWLTSWKSCLGVCKSLVQYHIHTRMTSTKGPTILHLGPTWVMAIANPVCGYDPTTHRHGPTSPCQGYASLRCGPTSTSTDYSLTNLQFGPTRHGYGPIQNQIWSYQPWSYSYQHRLQSFQF